MESPEVAGGDLADLAARAGELRPGRRALLGVTGAPGAGKSTLAASLAAAVPGAVVVPMDGFHLTTAELSRLGRVERRGAPDTFDADGFLALLASLRSARHDVWAPAFDRSIEEPVPHRISVPAAAGLVVVEGNYLLLDRPPWSRVRALLDAVWFVEIAEPVRVARLTARFVRFGMAPDRARQRVLRGSDARNAELIAATRHRADLVITPRA